MKRTSVGVDVWRVSVIFCLSIGLYDEEKGSCVWSEWMDEGERRLERLLGSKEMYDGLMGFARRVFEKRRIGVGEGE